MKKVYIVSANRSPIGRAYKGQFKDLRPDEILVPVMKDALRRSAIPGTDIEDCIIGCATPEKKQGYNIARIAGLAAGLPDSVPALTINRFCSSGLEAIALAALKIKTGDAEVVLAGGVESMTGINMLTSRQYPSPSLYEARPEAYMGMGHTSEQVAQKYGISREDCDAFAVKSHEKALAAVARGDFAKEITAIPVTLRTARSDGTVHKSEALAKIDEGPRASTPEGLGRLRAAFNPKGVSTAGNSSQVSDGASVCILASEDYVKAHNLKPLAEFVDYTTAGVPPEIMGIGPVKAVPKLLSRNGLTVADLETIELNEAFAAQSLAVIADLGLDVDKVNPLGGAIALGHPLGCTGARLTTTSIYELQRRGGGYGLITMCVGGGMGAAGLIKVE